MLKTALVVFATALSAPAFAATCTIEVDGASVIDGPCDFEDIGGGDFVVSADGQFAYVYASQKPVAGFWNGVEKASHAHDPLGELKRSGACWVNDRAKVCAYAD